MKDAKLNPILHNLSQSLSGNDKRPDHPDFLTSAELKAKEWSGVRLNSLIDTYEFWICGEIKKTVSAVGVAADYRVLEKAHVELFGISVGRTS